MKRLVVLPLLLFTSFIQAQVHFSIPEGDIKGPFVWKSKIYPGSERDYWIYVPKQYDAAKPACVMVVQDGLQRATGWKLPSVLDSLIAAKEIPVIIGIFIDHGKVPCSPEDNYPRFNRSFEYDALGDRYARFLIDEILPEVSKSYNLSADPNDRSIAGASSGAICAFNAAWERPDQFRRVLSTIGTYVGLRGGDELATLVRKTEPKPLRVFLEDGNNDLNNYAGDWWAANQNMLSALTWAGYEVNHAWGDGGHDSKHASVIMADALKWLWKDYPSPVRTHVEDDRRINLLVDSEPWQEIKLNSSAADKLAINGEGDVFFSSGQTIYKLDSRGNQNVFLKLKGNVGGISFHSDGKLYVADLSQHKIVSIDEKGTTKDVMENVTANYLVTTRRGIYFSAASEKKIGFFSFQKKNIQYTTLPGIPSGLAVNAEQTFINAGMENNVFGYSFKIMNDGNLDFGQAYIHYHIPYGEAFPSVKGMTVDSDNLLYSATSMGIQVADQIGKVNFIFSKPSNNITDVKIGGPDFNLLFVSCDGKLLRRKINAKGILSWSEPVKPSKPRL